MHIWLYSGEESYSGEDTHCKRNSYWRRIYNGKTNHYFGEGVEKGLMLYKDSCWRRNYA